MPDLYTAAAFCICGENFVQIDVPSEDRAHWLAWEWWEDHLGLGHGPVSDEEVEVLWKMYVVGNRNEQR